MATTTTAATSDQSRDRRKTTCRADDLPSRPVGGDRESAAAPKVKTNNVYEVRPRTDHRGVATICDALPLIMALIVGGVLLFILLYFGSFLVTRRQDARLRSPPAQR